MVLAPPWLDRAARQLRWVLCLLVGLAASLAPAAPGGKEEPVRQSNSRLSAEPGGGVSLDGKPYRGIGVNYFSCFLRTLKRGDDTSYEAGFAHLAAKRIPFARFCATGFWPLDMKLYAEDRGEYFRRLDGVVRSAERHGIGLIPSLFWYYACVPDLVGEPMDQWANPDSKTRAFMRQYVREVVTRYRHNPTIWAWEFGNEYSLVASLPNAAQHRPPVHAALGTAATRSQRDELTFAMVRAAFTAFAHEVRSYDASRLIFTGDSFPRSSAWHQEHEGSWKQDSAEQLAEALRKATPDPVSGLSVHLYGDNDKGMATVIDVARKLNKPLLVGEFGAPGDGNSRKTTDEFMRLLNAVMKPGVALAAVWVFDYPQQPEWTIEARSARAWQLDLITAVNQQLAATAAPHGLRERKPRP